MSQPPSDPSRQKKAEADEDYKLRQAMSETRLNTNAAPREEVVAKHLEAAARAELRGGLLKIACALAVIGAVGGWFAYNAWSKNRAEAERIAAQTKFDKQAEAEVRKLLDENKLHDAQAALGEQQRHGFSSNPAGRLQEEIDRRIKEKTDELIAQVDQATKKHDVQAAQKLLAELDEVRSARSAPSTDDEIQRVRRNIELMPSRDLLAEARKLAESNAWEDALEKIQLARQSAHDEAEIANVEQELRRNANESLSAESRRAMTAENWDRAMAAFVRAERLTSDPGTLNALRSKLREKVGGRLLLEVQPANSTVVVPGRPPVQSGTTILGLPDGEVHVFVQAEGYIPTVVPAQVRFPDLTRVPVIMPPAHPGPVWAVCELSGSPGQSLAIEFYKKSVHGPAAAALVTAIEKVAQPVVSTPAKAPRKIKLTDGSVLYAESAVSIGPSKEELRTLDGQVQVIERANIEEETEASAKEACEARLPIEAGAFLHPKMDASHPNGDVMFAAFNRLAVFANSSEAARLSVLQKCDSQIRSYLEVLERACSACRGHQSINCPECNGKAKRTELRNCVACKGARQRKCPACNGTTHVKCRHCHGSGTVERIIQGSGRGKGPFAPETVVKEACTACSGQGWLLCNKCTKGILKCTKCNGAGRANLPGPCSKCDGKGQLPCGPCAGSGLREKMTIESRLERESEITAKVGA